MSLIQVTKIPFRRAIIDGSEMYISDIGDIRLVTTDLSLLDGGASEVFNSGLNTKVPCELSMNLPSNVAVTPHPTIPKTYVIASDVLGVMVISKQRNSDVPGVGEILAVAADLQIENHTPIVFEFLAGHMNPADAKSQLYGLICLSKYAVKIPTTFAYSVTDKILSFNGRLLNHDTTEIRYGTIPSVDEKDAFFAESEAEMLALEINAGDHCYRNDLNLNFVNTTGINESISDWVPVSGSGGIDVTQATTISVNEINGRVPNMIAAGLSTTRNHLADLCWHSTDDINSLLINPNDMERFNTYWCNVKHHHDTLLPQSLTVEFTTDESNIVITNIGENNKFKVAIGGIDLAGALSKEVVFHVLIDDGVIPPVERDYSVTISRESFIMGMIGLNSTEVLTGATCDASNNIVCVGTTTSLGAGNNDALILHYANDMTLLGSVVLGGSSEDYFNAVTMSDDGNIICVGYTRSYGSGRFDALIAKLNPELDIITKGVYGGSNDDYFTAIDLDAAGNIICVGYTRSEGEQYFDTLIVKFDINMNILAKKVYGGNQHDYLYGVKVLNDGNIVCVGSTKSDGAGGYDGLIVKFDPNLSILYSKTYGASNDDKFTGVTEDALGNIYAAGQLNDSGLVVKFDTNLNVLLSKKFDYASGCIFNAIKLIQDHLIVVGITDANTTGDNGLICDLNLNLAHTNSATYGGLSDDSLNGLTADSHGNVIVVGKSSSDGQGSDDGLCLRWNVGEQMPSGTYGGQRLPRLVYTEIIPTITNSVATLSPAVLTLNNSNLTYQVASLTLAKVILTSVIDRIQI